MPPDIDISGDFADASDIADFALDLAESRTHILDRPANPAHLPVLDALHYDFDIVAIEPDAAQKAHLAALADLGQPVQGYGYEARWREMRTVTAIKNASPAARDLLQDAGFGTEVSGSRLPPGVYDIKDGPQRHQVVMKLTNMLAMQNADQLDWGEFNTMAFFKAHSEAEGLPQGPPVDPVLPHTKPPNHKRMLALLGCVMGFGLLGLAIVSLL